MPIGGKKLSLTFSNMPDPLDPPEQIDKSFNIHCKLYPFEFSEPI